MSVVSKFATAIGCAILAAAAFVAGSSASSGQSTERLRLVSVDGQRWRIDGEADTAEADLRSVPGHNAFWFAWSAFHPGTKVWEGAPIRYAIVATDALGGCTVPCNEIFAGCRGRDCIPPLDSPQMVPPDSPNASYVRDDDMVLGVRTKAGPRAYPHNVLWWHEIVNETAGGESYAISFCPLTGSGLRFDRSAFVEGRTVRLGVSGLLYNSNLVMWDRETESLWSRLRAKLGDMGVVTDEVGGVPIAVVFHGPSRFVHAFDRRVGGKTQTLTLSGGEGQRQ